MVAGDPERAHMEKVEREGGICYHNNLLHAMVMYIDTDFTVRSVLKQKI